MKIYVGNLSYGVTGEQLHAMFAAFGEVESASLITDKYSGESKGFGFVEMARQADAEKAIKELNGQSNDGRNLKVNIAKPKNDRPQSRSKGW